MKNQLAIDTSTDTCSVALRTERGIQTRSAQGKGIHSEQLFIQIQDLIKNASLNISDISEVLVSSGPGSYTGLRIAASAIKGLFFGIDSKVYGLNTLAGFAASITDDKVVHAIIDARRQHVYYQKFQNSETSLYTKGEVNIVPISSFDEIVKPDDIIIGTGYERLSEKLQALNEMPSEPVQAASLFRLYDLWKDGKTNAEFVLESTIADFEPNYFSSSQVTGNVI